MKINVQALLIRNIPLGGKGDKKAVHLTVTAENEAECREQVKKDFAIRFYEYRIKKLILTPAEE